jgi:hypothetical protein
MLADRKGMLMAVDIADRISGLPEWLEPSFTVKPGRDPLGFQTITTDRVMPWLLPGVLELSRRARYFSFHPFILDEYERAKLPASNRALSDFIRTKEYELRLAADFCPRQCGAAHVMGYYAARRARRDGANYVRSFSVDSYLGGYGLYYRSPLADMNVVAVAGTQLGELPTPVDVLRRDERAQELAASFREACQDTDYYQTYLRGNRPIPETVLRDYAKVACLCRLAEHKRELEAIRDLFFRASQGSEELPPAYRRQAFSLFLALAEQEPEVAASPIGHRVAIWDAFSQRGMPERALESLARWSALVAKDWLQEAICSVWLEFCQRGLTAQGADGLSMAEVRRLIRGDLFSERRVRVVGKEFELYPERTVFELDAAVRRELMNTGPEVISRWTVETGSALSGLLAVLALCSVLPALDDVPQGWQDVGLQQSREQPGLLRTKAAMDELIASGATLADAMEHIVRRCILQAHEMIAYSKLPDFTFRFRWENARLRFFDNGVERPNIAGARWWPISLISEDLDLFRREEASIVLTDAGRTLVKEAFP